MNPEIDFSLTQEIDLPINYGKRFARIQSKNFAA